MPLNGSTILNLPIASGLGSADQVWLEIAKFDGSSWVSNRASVETITDAASGFVPTSRRVDTAIGLTGGGALTSDLTLDLDIDKLSAKSAMVVADTFAINNSESSDTAFKVTFPNAMKALTGLSALALPSASDDYLIINRGADGETYKVNIDAMSLSTGGVPSGGTTGQVLTKASNVNFDTVWANDSGANTALSNLASVAINTSLLPGSTGIALGNGSFPFADFFLENGAVIDWNNGATTLTHSAGLLTLADANLVITDTLAASGVTATVRNLADDGYAALVAENDLGAAGYVLLHGSNSEDYYCAVGTDVDIPLVLEANEESKISITATQSQIFSVFSTGTDPGSTARAGILMTGTAGEHLTTGEQLVAIKYVVEGSGINGPVNADCALTLSLLKDNYGDGLAAGTGEINGLNVNVRQAGTLSDSSAILINTGHYGSGFNAVMEANNFFEVGADTYRLNTQIGVINNDGMGGVTSLGFGAIAGDATEALGPALYVTNTTGDTWSHVVQALYNSAEIFAVDGETGALRTASSATIEGTVTVGLTGTTLGTVALSGSTSGAVTLAPAAAAGTWTLTLPTNDGDSGQFLQTNGSGVTSWAGASSVGTALTAGNDTNVTLTLGGAPTTALLTAASITAGWTGQLALTRGGTNASLTASNGGIVYSDASALAILAGTATAGQIVRSGTSAAPSWSTATYPATTAAGTILASGSANTIAGTATPTLGIAGTTLGTLALAGNTSGTVTIRPAAAAGTWTFTLPTTDGDANQFLQTNGSGVTTWAAAPVPTTITVANEATDTSCFIAFFTAATGDLGPKTNANLTFNSSTGVLTAGQTIVGSVSGNAGTVTVADAGGDTTTFPMLATSATGNLSPATDAGLTYNATTNALTTTTFIGALTGNADTVTWANEAADTTCFIGFATAASGSLAPKTNTNMTFNSSTGVATFASTVLTTTDINGGTIDGATIGGASPAAGTFTTAVANSFVPNAATVPSNGMYLPAANTLGWAINSAAELQLTGTALSPAADGGSSLGTTALGWSDLFLADGGVVNWGNGTVTLTDVSGTLEVLADEIFLEKTNGSGGNTGINVSNPSTDANSSCGFGWASGTGAVGAFGAVHSDAATYMFTDAGSFAFFSAANMSFEADLNIIMASLPTADPAVAGALWVDTGAGRVVKQSAG